jgi:hypothetical protein
VDLLVEVGEELGGGGAGLGGGVAGWVELVAVEVGEAVAEEGFEAVAGVRAGGLQVG